MSGINKVMLIGRLGADPEMKTISNGNAVTRFNLATSETWMDRNGEKQERTEWHRIVVWGKLAELCNHYLSKGRDHFGRYGSRHARAVGRHSSLHSWSSGGRSGIRPSRP